MAINLDTQENPDRFCLCGCGLAVAPQNRSGWLKIHRHRSPERKAIVLKAKQKRKIKLLGEVKVSQIKQIGNYAVHAVKALMDGDSIKIDNDEYIYQDGRILVRATRIDGGVESEVWLGGMCSEISLEYFLIHCAEKTFDDQVRDFPFPVKISQSIRSTKYQEQINEN